MRGVRTLVVILVSVMVVSGYGQDCRPQNDSAVLVDLYGASKGINWKVKWDLNQPFSKWHGITVNNSGCVTAISLPENGLQGNIPDIELPFLKKLDVSGNNILSTLPALSRVPSLEHLDLSNNRFIGSLPKLTNSDKMRVILANNNRLDGSIPDYSAMTELEQLDLADNNLTGSIMVLSHFDQLTYLDLSKNQLQGGIPILNDKPGLNEINLSGNKLSGELPDLDGLTSLAKVNFSENRLTGSFRWPADVPELTELKISNNLLGDTIPNTGPVGKLTLFYASNNQFTGQIPSMELPLLEELMISQNQLSGAVPDFAGLPALEQFTVRHNNLDNLEFGPDLFSQIAFADVSENRLTFQDLIPFRNFRGSSISMFPQKPIGFKTPTFTVTKGNNFTIELNTDEKDASTDYQWFKDGKRLEIGDKKDFFISNVIPRDAGEYKVTMTNSLFPGFPIMSEIFTLVVNCPQVVTDRIIYLCPDEVFSYKGTEFSRDTVFSDTVFSQSDLVCDSLYLFEIKNYEPDSVHAITELCEGEIYYFGPDSIELTRSGTYLDTFPNLGGCDSIVLLGLEFRDSYKRTMDVGLCPGDSLLFGDSVYYEDVSLVDSFTSVYGCDSLIILEVRFSDPVRTTTRYDICEGDSVLVNGQYYSISTTWTDTLTARGGCDSISTVEIQLREIYESTLNINLCSPETFEWQGRELHQSGNFSDTLQSIYGCDSIVHLNLTISPSYFSRDTLYICQGDSVLFNRAWLTGSGIYFSDQSTIQGCDSMNVLVLEIHDYAEKLVTLEICGGDTVMYNNKSYAGVGIYTDTLTSLESCDTLVTLEIMLNEFEIVDSTITGTGSEDSTGSIAVEISGGISPYKFQWSTGDTTSSLDSVPAGDYTLVVTDSVGCTTTFEVTVPVLTFVWQSPEMKNWIKIRPNYLDRSQRSSVFFDVQEPMHNSRIYLYNELGQPVSHKDIERLNPGESLEWHLGDYPSGLYYFHIREEGKPIFQVERLVIF